MPSACNPSSDRRGVCLGLWHLSQCPHFLIETVNLPQISQFLITTQKIKKKRKEKKQTNEERRQEKKILQQQIIIKSLEIQKRHHFGVSLGISKDSLSFFYFVSHFRRCCLSSLFSVSQWRSSYLCFVLTEKLISRHCSIHPPPPLLLLLLLPPPPPLLSSTLQTVGT